MKVNFLSALTFWRAVAWRQKTLFIENSSDWPVTPPTLSASKLLS
jgi:hypothetical protein